MREHYNNHRAILESAIMDLTVGDFIIDRNSKKIFLNQTIINKMTRNNKLERIERDIQSFELTAEYYIESWICGNKTHVINELIELKKTDSNIFTSILIELPNEIQLRVVETLRK